MNLKFAWSRDNLPCCLFPFAPYKSWTSFSTEPASHRFDEPPGQAVHYSYESSVLMTQTGLQEAKDPISQNLQKTAFMGSYLSVFHALSLSPSLSPPQELWAISKFISTSSASCPPETNMELKISCYRSVSSSMEKCSSSILFFRSGSMTPCTAPLAPRAKARQPSVPLQQWAPATSDYTIWMCSRVSTITYA